MELNLKTTDKETEFLFGMLKMNVDRGFNSDHNKAEMMNSVLNAMIPLLNKPQSTMFIPPGIAVDSALPSDEQLKMMTADEAAFQKAVDARDTLKRMISPLHM